MPRSFDMASEFGGSVEQVLGAYRDEQYWLARLADSGADHATLDSLTVGRDGTVSASTTQVLARDRLPGVAAQFIKGDLSIVRHETWSPARNDRADGKVTGSIPRAPVSVTGTGLLAPAAKGSRLDVRATVEVRIPLLGGKLESFIGGQLVDLLSAEQRFTTVWITEHA